MASLELTTNELAVLVAPYMKDYVKHLEGISDGFRMTIIYDTGIPLVPDEIPIKLVYNNFKNSEIAFTWETKFEGFLMQQAANLIKSFIPELIKSKTFPPGISLTEEKVLIDTNKLMLAKNIPGEIKDFYLSQSKIAINYSV